jgi:P-type E1-E2 ATPase
LSYAYRDFELEEFQKLMYKYGGFWNEAHRHVIESSLIFAATFWLSDPLRENVEQVIYDMWEAGTNTRILSGDHKETVLKAALKVGIIEPGPTDSDMSG